MKSELTFEDCGSFLKAQMSGRWEATAIDRQVAEIRQEAQRRGHSQVLVDTCQVSPANSGVDRFNAGRSIAYRWSSPIRAAFLRQDERPDGPVINAAMNRDANIAIFSTPEPAMRWLQQAT